jgi:hypothetical protein
MDSLCGEPKNLSEDNRMENKTGWIWVFHGNGARLAAAAFSSKELAEQWIYKHSAHGTLTKMPLDTGIYDWAIENDFFSPKRNEQKLGEFVQTFTSAYLEHYHYEKQSPPSGRAENE